MRPGRPPGYSNAIGEVVKAHAIGATDKHARVADHTHDPVPEGTGIDGTESVYVIEGNYILMPQEPWTSAATHFDLSIFLDAPDSLLIERMIPRHERSGRSIAEAKNKIADADLPNAAIVRSSRGRADILFQDSVDA